MKNQLRPLMVITTALGFAIAALAYQPLSALAQAERPLVAVNNVIVESNASTFESWNLDPEEIRLRTEETLRGTRRFRMFERDSDTLNATVMQEQEFAQSGYAAGNTAQAGNLQNVELIVAPLVTNFRFGSSFAEQDGLPGIYRRTDSGALTVVFRILDTTTGEIKYQTTQSSQFRRTSGVIEGRTGGPTREQYFQMAEEVATLGASAVVDYVFPILVVQYQNGQLYLNRGEGGSLAVGDERDVYAPGIELIDPISGENLGSTETLVGRVRVARIAERFTIAEFVSGPSQEPAPGDIVRRIQN